mgnify:CR=1 FL=1
MSLAESKMADLLCTDVLVIGAGLATVFARGGLPLGVDFTGGTVIVLDFVNPVDENAVRAALGRRADARVLPVIRVHVRMALDAWKAAVAGQWMVSDVDVLTRRCLGPAEAHSPEIDEQPVRGDLAQRRCPGFLAFQGSKVRFLLRIHVLCSHPV